MDGGASEARTSGVDLRVPRQSGRAEKQRILDEFMRVYGDRHNYVIELLERPLLKP